MFRISKRSFSEGVANKWADRAFSSPTPRTVIMHGSRSKVAAVRLALASLYMSERSNVSNLETITQAFLVLSLPTSTLIDRFRFLGSVRRRPLD